MSKSFFQQKYVLFRSLAALVIATATSSAIADDPVTDKSSLGETPLAAKEVWAVSIDNDLFVPLASSDRDFTGGMAFTYSGKKGARYWSQFDQVLNGIDTAIFPASSVHLSIPSIEVGLYGFTPNAIEQDSAVYDDRPYASLVYLSINRLYQLRDSEDSVSSSLTWGLLGTDLVGDAQNDIHRAIGSEVSRGWQNQISDGGEITARYQIAYHDYWKGSKTSGRFKTTYFSSLGYLTEVGVALSTRQGLISSPSNRFHPELISYGERVNELASAPSYGKESYFWGGVTLKARLYNAFLQGQFRDSEHTFAYGELRPIIAEAWLGYTFTIGHHYKASYVLRAQTSEIKEGAGDRGHIWGGVVFGRYI